jgi:hypothetical protein
LGVERKWKESRWTAIQVINQKANREDVIPKRLNVIITGSIGGMFFSCRKKTVSNILYVAFYIYFDTFGWLVGWYVYRMSLDTLAGFIFVRIGTARD